MENDADLQKLNLSNSVGAQAAHTSWREVPADAPDLPSTCIVCGHPPTRYVSLAAAVAGPEGRPETDISIGGFCLAHRDSAAGALSDSLLADDDVLSLFGPAVELQAHEVAPFLQLMQEQLDEG